MRCLAAQESDLGVKSALFAKQNFYESCEGYYVHRYLVNVVSGLGRENTFEKKIDIGKGAWYIIKGVTRKDIAV